MFYRIYTPTARLISQHPSTRPQDKTLGRAFFASFVPPYTAHRIQDQTLKLEGLRTASPALLFLNGTAVEAGAQDDAYALLLEARDPSRPLLFVLQETPSSQFDFPGIGTISAYTHSTLTGMGVCPGLGEIFRMKDALKLLFLWWMFGWTSALVALTDIIWRAGSGFILGWC